MFLQIHVLYKLYKQTCVRSITQFVTYLYSMCFTKIIEDQTPYFLHGINLVRWSSLKKSNENRHKLLYDAISK